MANSEKQDRSLSDLYNQGYTDYKKDPPNAPASHKQLHPTEHRPRYVQKDGAYAAVHNDGKIELLPDGPNL